MKDQTNFTQFSFGTQVRKSPYSDAALRWGAQGFSVYNHMYIPRDFGDPVQNFWNLVNEAILCDVSVERQVEITGPDAAKFTQFLSCRDLSKMQVGQCKYVLSLLCNCRDRNPATCCAPLSVTRQQTSSTTGSWNMTGKACL